MHAISSYRGNRPTNTRRPPAANTQTGQNTIHCAANLSAQCNKTWRESDIYVADGVLERLFELDQFTANVELHLVERGTDLFHVLHQRGYRVVVVTDASRQALSFVEQLSHGESLLHDAVEYRLQSANRTND